VSRRLADYAAQIQVFWLAPYSPELNPDELLNQDVKTNALGRVRPLNLSEMMRSVRSYLRITQRRPRLVKNYFRERQDDTPRTENCHVFDHARSSDFV
jgi:DDE superfamily endonuclease